MSLSEYQQTAGRTAIYPNQRSVDGLVYTVIGLNGEAGEVAEQVKKMIRNDGFALTEERKEKLVDELGDVLWYCAMLATELQVDLAWVASRNIRKLEDRQRKGQLKEGGR